MQASTDRECPPFTWAERRLSSPRDVPAIPAPRAGGPRLRRPDPRALRPTAERRAQRDRRWRARAPRRRLVRVLLILFPDGNAEGRPRAPDAFVRSHRRHASRDEGAHRRAEREGSRGSLHVLRADLRRLLPRVRRR